KKKSWEDVVSLERHFMGVVRTCKQGREAAETPRYISCLPKLTMESAIKTVVGQFVTSCRGKDSLSSNNFQKLVQSQLKNVMSDTDNSSAVKQMMCGLDENQDGKVSIQEYLTLVGYLANSMSERKYGVQNSTDN
ncbi:hypothetical protein P4O66_010652, partial [Electrophorus voltai]